MRVDTSAYLNAIHGCRDIWAQVYPQIPTPENLSGIGVGVNDITVGIDQLIRLLEILGGSDVDAIALSIHKPGLESNINGVRGFFTSYASNPAQFHASAAQICSWIWGLKSSLIQLVPIHPEASRLSPDFERHMSTRIEEAQGWFGQAEALKSAIAHIEATSRESLKALQLQRTESNSTTEAIQAILTTVQGQEREAGTAKTNAISSAVTANTEAATVAKLVQELLSSVEVKTTLFNEFEGRREEIAGLLENANKVGLARSFSDKRKQLTWTWRGWAFAFFVGICGLLAIGLLELLPLLKTGSPDPVSVLARFSIASPLVWFTWFAARQYGVVLRVSEDYAFKEAAAMAFVGYRNEMGADAEMLKMLRESAIRNFGANPAEMLLKRADASSPLHDALEHALEKMEPKQVMETLTSLVSSLKSK